MSVSEEAWTVERVSKQGIGAEKSAPRPWLIESLRKVSIWQYNGYAVRIDADVRARIKPPAWGFFQLLYHDRQDRA